jgi:ABC-type amino acid transport substrate-binding protein
MAINTVFQLEERNSNQSLLKSLLLNRIDVAIINPGLPALKMVISGDEQLMANKNRFVALQTPLWLIPNHLAFAKHMKKTKLLQRFSQIMKERYASGEIQKIIAKYE